MQVVVIDCGSKRLANIHRLVNMAKAEYVSVPLQESHNYRFNNTCAVIISGGPHLFTGPEGKTLADKFSFLNKIFVPVLGICLGHQALGHQYGAEIFKGTPRRKEEYISCKQSHPLLHGLRDGITINTDHCEGITCPEGFTVLASSKYYENEIMANDNKRFYGIQGHPETSGETGRILIYNFLNIARVKSNV